MTFDANPGRARPQDTPVLPRVRRSIAVRYGIVLAAVALAFTARIAMMPILNDQAPYLFFLPVVLLAAGIGGFGPGILATGLCFPLVLFFVARFSEFDWSTALNGAVFLAIGLGAALFGERLRQARLSISARAAHFQSIFDTIPDAVVVIDEKGTIQSFNAMAERLFGYSAAEAVGNNVSTLMPSPYREEHDGYIKRYLENTDRRDGTINQVAAGQTKNGSTFPIEITIGEMSSGTKRFFTGFIRDLTERQKTETRLQELQSELVHVSRLTAMGEMASALAHELNQPLSAIANYLKGSRRLLDGSADKPAAIVRDALDQAGNQALRAGQIIRRLRNFVARGESERRVENVTKLVQEAASLALVGARENGVRVAFNFDQQSQFVLADKLQIQQVLVNLIRNGLDAMEDSVRKELTICTALVENGMIAVQVTDTGSGISDEMASKLFQPFITTKPHGMGVGLSISRTIVEAHGGKIEATPGLNGGAAFRFTLRPAKQDENSDAEQ